MLSNFIGSRHTYVDGESISAVQHADSDGVKLSVH
jgi:hypothetical protein